MKKLAASAVLFALFLSGCSVSPDSDQKLKSGDGVYVFTQTVEGKPVHCIFVNGYRNGSLSCDWSGR